VGNLFIVLGEIKESTFSNFVMHIFFKSEYDLYFASDRRILLTNDLRY
jgi:hypothetical protein